MRARIRIKQLNHNQYSPITRNTEPSMRILSYINHLFLFHYIADNLRKYHDDMLLLQDMNEKEKRAALHTDLTQYWATFQRVEDSRDADLKCGLKGAYRITDPKNKMGPASMQIFKVGSA